MPPRNIVPGTRPRLDFSMRRVQWRFIVPRSLDDFVSLNRFAGVDDDRRTISVPADGVHAVATVDV